VRGHRNSWKAGVLLIFSILALASFRCSSAQRPAQSKPAVKRIPADRACAGFLKDYRVEMELVDSRTGERIAAMVDRTNLGAHAEVGARNFSRVEKFADAREALDEWASRVRTFLDSDHELRGEDAERADKSYRPYYGFEETKL